LRQQKSLFLVMTLQDSAPKDESSEITLSIVMPCLNEAQTIARCVEKANSWLRRKKVSGEVIVADNGSSDGSSLLAAEAGARVVSVPEKGYGSALLGGIAAARGQFIIMGDADESYDFGALGPMFEALNKGYELVMGNRFKGGVLPGAMPFSHRYFGNPMLNLIGRLFFRSPCGDPQCGLRGFTKMAIKKMDLRATGMEFASEMVVKASLQNLRITEVPVTLSPDGRTRPPHLRTWRDGWRNLRFLLLFSPRWLFLYPGILLMAGGLILGAWLLPGPLYVENIAFDVQTLLYAAMAVLLGFQAIAFAVFTKAFAINQQLLPDDPRFNKIMGGVGLEAGLITGALLFCFGIAGSIWAVSFWKAHGFGPLDTSKTLRLVVPSVTAVTLGFQIMLWSFFLSVLRLKRRR
jgi:glycosyltransferase involved in cell wall biosynthesis